MEPKPVDQDLLVKILFKFDTSNYLYNFSLKNQFSRNYGNSIGKGFWFHLSVNILYAINTFLQILLIGDNDINNLAKYG